MLPDLKNGRKAKCSAENPVFYEDEVDIHLSPKIGAVRLLHGKQQRNTRPELKILSDFSRTHSGTGKVSYAGENSKKSSLFIRLLTHIKATYR